MNHVLCILTLCLTQALWLSSSVLTFSTEKECGVDCVSVPGDSLHGSVTESEIEDTEFIGHAAWFDVDADRARSLHVALSLLPVPSRPVDARGSRPPPQFG